MLGVGEKFTFYAGDLYVTRLWTGRLENSWYDSQHRQEIFLFSNTSRLAVSKSKAAGVWSWPLNSM